MNDDVSVAATDRVDVVLANNDRVTLRVGDTFLKVDTDRDRAEHEVAAIELAPVPTPEIRWHRHPVLALAAVPGQTLGRLGEAPTATPAAWAAAGAALRMLHDAPLPPWPERGLDELASTLDDECRALVDDGVLARRLIDDNRRIAEGVLRSHSPAFIHGDLHLEHLFVDGDEVTGIIDWSEARRGDPVFDIASLTLANDASVDDLLAGYGRDVDRTVIRAWWAYRCLVGVRWLVENGYGAPDELPEVDVLRSLAGSRR